MGGLDMTMKRRAFLYLLSLGALSPLTSCVSTRANRAKRPAPSGDPTVDFSFAEMVLAGASAGSLSEHAAMDGLIRHQRMVGVKEPAPVSIAERILSEQIDRDGTLRVLKQWRQRAGGLVEQMKAAGALLPEGSPAPACLYVVTGYDIGVATPPDVLLNAAHEHFIADPEEGLFYACHEAHHVGFLAHQTFPDLGRLTEPGQLAAVVSFITQMEGMAVHAAYGPRRSSGSLGADPDYEVYLSDEAAHKVILRYGEVFQRAVDEATTEELLGDVLNAMTSGERLAYRFGALVSRQVEEAAGRKALIETVCAPLLFREAADSLLESASKEEEKFKAENAHDVAPADYWKNRVGADSAVEAMALPKIDEIFILVKGSHGTAHCTFYKDGRMTGGHGSPDGRIHMADGQLDREKVEALWDALDKLSPELFRRRMAPGTSWTGYSSVAFFENGEFTTELVWRRDNEYPDEQVRKLVELLFKNNIGGW